MSHINQIDDSISMKNKSTQNTVDDVSNISNLTNTKNEENDFNAFNSLHLTKEQKIERKKRLIAKRKEHKSIILELQSILKTLLHKRNYLYKTLSKEIEFKLHSELVELQKQFDNSISKIDKENIEVKIKSINHSLFNLHGYVKHLPEIEKIRDEIKSIKKDI